MKSILLLIITTLIYTQTFCWGFYSHRIINKYAVFLLPPKMMVLYKPNIDYLMEHSVDPDKRRYAVKEEGPRHYIDIDHYGKHPFPDLPRKWKDAVAKYTEDTIIKNGIVPWWTQTMLKRLENAFRKKDKAKILRYSAEIGHYIADSHVPLHCSSNHNGQHTNQHGIHGLWETRIPELLSKDWDFFIGKAQFIHKPLDYIWERVLESSLASDTVLRFEKRLTDKTDDDRKYAYEKRNEKIIRQYSSDFTSNYDKMMKGMVERRLRTTIFSVSSFWYTAWVRAGQPDLSNLKSNEISIADQTEFEELNKSWKKGKVIGRGGCN